MQAQTSQPVDFDHGQISEWNAHFATIDAAERVALALEDLPGAHVLSSSFGAQAAVSLHLLTTARPEIPVILLDTGYLFDETYQFVDELTNRLDLNLHVYRSKVSPLQQELTHGQRWLQGAEGIDSYNYENKVEPMQRALQELQVGTRFTGIRRAQAETREHTPFVQI
ncbi:MAG: phosphoadenylyl-sulfate reductase, partial [Pseudomonadota bacterium]